MKMLLLALVLFYNTNAFSQANLVLNPGFEKYDTCPYKFDQIRLATHWNCLDTNKATQGVGFPEYYNVCGTDLSRLATVPDNGHFFQYPHTGKGMSDAQVFIDESIPPPFLYYKRDYLQGKLYKKLTVGKQYCVTFFVNLMEASGYAIQDIGAYLDNGLIDTATDIAAPQTQWQPQVYNTTGILSDTAAWVRIQGSFVAKGNEQFITIGNFKDKAHTTYVPVPLNHYNNNSDACWYLIDDVSVIAIDTKADAGPDTHVAEDSAFIGRPNEVGLECTWAVLGSSTVIGTGAGIKVKPSITTSYVVTQILCGTVTRDTVKVDVWPAGINSVNSKEQVYTLSPNPVQQTLHLSQQVHDGRAVMVSIYEATGKQVYSGSLHFADNKAGVNVGGLAAGFYFVELKDGGGNGYRMKLLKE